MLAAEKLKIAPAIGSFDKKWLEDALPLDVYNSKSKRLRKITDEIFGELEAIIETSNRTRIKVHLKSVLINLWIGWKMGLPTRYSRRKQSYQAGERYRALFFRYKYLIPIVDAMETAGLIYQKPGFFQNKTGNGRQTRMWSLPKLQRYFIHHDLQKPDFYEYPGPEEVIILKDRKKYVSYRETTKTKAWREGLEQYNTFIKKNEITVELNERAELNLRFFLQFVLPEMMKNRITINITNKHKSTSPSITGSFYSKLLTVKGLRDFDDRGFSLLKTLVNLSRTLRLVEPETAKNKILEETFLLGDMGMEKLSILLRRNSLYRVFNRKSFRYGGRAYGATHQQLPKQFRQYICINGLQTIELDYSAYHIRMLYHREGIEYLGDPFCIRGDGLRDTFKLVGLIAINAKNEQSAHGAILKELKAKGLPLPKVKKPLSWLMREFKENHKPIAKYLFSDIGITLQNTDSIIMSEILIKLMGLGIVGLPVHDSVIVAEENQEVLRRIMTDKYKKVVGFRPRF